MTTRIAIIGATGYTGAELIEILADHPDAELVALFASQASGGPRELASVHPRLRGAVELPVQPWSHEALTRSGAEIAFLATPARVSAALAPALLEAGILTLDLSGAHRLGDSHLRRQHYSDAPAAPAAMERCAYGLPELSRDAVADADLIACAGCYATAVALALAPIIRKKLIDTDGSVAVSAVSGVSGAGRAASVSTHFCEVSLRPYAPLSHRHQPEIEQSIGADVAFTPHIAPFDRGIVATAHTRLSPCVGVDDIATAFRAAYADEPLIRLLGADESPSVGAVRHLDVCDIGFAVDERRGAACVMSALDNLRKGAAGQAVQCMNIRLGLPETTGLRCGSAQREAPA